MSRTPRRIIVTSCILALAALAAWRCPAAAAQDSYWNQFRGPHADGSTRRTSLPLTWSEQQNVAWKTPIHGRGWSSPVVWKDRVFVTTATEDGRRLSVLALDVKSGKVLHDEVIFEVAEPKFRHPKNSYASPTPFVEEGRLYVHFGAYGTACIDIGDYRVVWTRRDFVCDDFRGPGSSPIVEGDLLFVHFDGVDVQYVAALNKRTGRTVWKQDRNIDYGTDNPDRKKAYGTPLLIEHQGRQQLVSPSAVETIAYDPPTGKELWRVRHGGMNAAARPLFRHGLVYIVAGQGDRSLIAVRPEGSGRLDDERIAWESGTAVPRRPSPVLHGSLLIMIDDSGIASCRDAVTGELHWRERLGGEHWASPLLAEGRVYFFSKSGEMPVVAASSQFEKLAENHLDDGMVASPAVADSALLLRTATHLYRVERQQQ